MSHISLCLVLGEGDLDVVIASRAEAQKTEADVVYLKDFCYNQFQFKALRWKGRVMELPYHFPDPLEEAARRCVEFQRLPPEERLRQLMDVIETGFITLRHSAGRKVSDRLFEQREAEWRRIQQDLLIRHGA